MKNNKPAKALLKRGQYGPLSFNVVGCNIVVWEMINQVGLPILIVTRNCLTSCNIF